MPRPEWAKPYPSRRPEPGTWSSSGNQKITHVGILVSDGKEGQKGGEEVGKTKVGKGCKLMAIGEGKGLPIALRVSRANPHESS